MAKQALASFLAQEVQAGRGLELIERPTLTPTEAEDEVVRNNPQTLVDRAILLANRKLDAALAETGSVPAEKKLLELARDRYDQTVKIWANSMIRGGQVVQTFEGEDANGQWCIGVVFVWSPKLQELADIVAVGGDYAEATAAGPAHQRSNPAGYQCADGLVWRAYPRG